MKEPRDLPKPPRSQLRLGCARRAGDCLGEILILLGGRTVLLSGGWGDGQGESVEVVGQQAILEKNCRLAVLADVRVPVA